MDEKALEEWKAFFIEFMCKYYGTSKKEALEAYYAHVESIGETLCT